MFFFSRQASKCSNHSHTYTHFHTCTYVSMRGAVHIYHHWQQGSPWNINAALNKAAQYNWQFNSAAANTLFHDSQERTCHLFSWPKNVWEQATSGGTLREAEYRSLAIRHVRMLSYGHKWVIMTQKDKTQECHQRRKSKPFIQVLLNGCVSDIVFLCCQGTIRRTQHLFQIKKKCHSPLTAVNW